MVSPVLAHELTARFWLTSLNLEEASHERVSTPMNKMSLWKENPSSEVGIAVIELVNCDAPRWVYSKTKKPSVGPNPLHSEVSSKGGPCLLGMGTRYRQKAGVCCQ